jgi:putative OPT family oligopeptide transporter
MYTIVIVLGQFTDCQIMPTVEQKKPTQKQYPQTTPLSFIVGISIGLVLVAAITYSGLILGFTIAGSTIAAIAGWGIIRGVFRRGTIVENNIVQTVASSVNVASAGVIFTIPVLFIRGDEFDLVPMVLSCIAGSFLGFFFIIPLRKQMIDLERLRFPSGLAVAAILRSPGAGTQKLVLLGIGIASSMIFTVITSLLHIETIDLNQYLPFVPKSFNNVWALSLMCVGAGYLAGKAGFLLLIGGILSYWVITPITISAGWLSSSGTPAIEELLEVSYKTITRPMGIGMLVGGAAMGIVVSLPAMKAAIQSLMRSRVGRSTEEMPGNLVGIGIVLSFGTLTGVALLTSDISLANAVLIATVGTLWLALAGVVVSQCTGMTDTSPISGISMMGVAIVLWLSEKNVVLSVTIGAAICMSLSQCADIMQDLKTGFLVGSKPFRQQAAQLAVTWIGPIVSILVIYLLAKTNEFGTPQLPAPQASALSSTITAICGGDIPMVKYTGGFALGALISLFGVP